MKQQIKNHVCILLIKALKSEMCIINVVSQRASDFQDYEAKA